MLTTDQDNPVPGRELCVDVEHLEEMEQAGGLRFSPMPLDAARHFARHHPIAGWYGSSRTHLLNLMSGPGAQSRSYQAIFSAEPEGTVNLIRGIVVSGLAKNQDEVGLSLLALAIQESYRNEDNLDALVAYVHSSYLDLFNQMQGKFGPFPFGVLPSSEDPDDADGVLDLMAQRLQSRVNH